MAKNTSTSKLEKPRPVKGRTPSRGKASPVAANEIYGIGALTRSLGVGDDFVMAVTCSMLTGLGGPEALLQAPWGTSHLPKLDLLTGTTLAANRLIECLSAPLQRLDRRLFQSMGNCNPEAIKHLAIGSFAADNPKKGSVEERANTLRRNLEFLTPQGSNSLLGDLKFDPTVQRIEAVLHPQMLVRNAVGRDLPYLVEECHFRSALVIQPKLGLSREGSEPAQVIGGLLPLLDGTLTKSQAGGPGGPRNCNEPARAQMILSLDQDELQTLSGPSHGLLDRMLWASAEEAESKRSEKSDGALVFFEAFQSATEEIIGLRREGLTLIAGFESSENLADFYDRLRVYEEDVAKMRSRPGISVIGLPQSLFWGLTFLQRSLPEILRIPEKQLVTIAFTCARRVAARHDCRVNSLRNAALSDDRLSIARRVVEKLEDQNGPLKLREFARLFRQQNSARFIPILAALVDVEVLVRDEGGGYLRGPAELEDVADLFVAELEKTGDMTT